MIKRIGTKVTSDITRFCRKNSVSGRYSRAMVNAQLCSALTLVEAARVPLWGVHDIGIMSALGTFTLNSFKNLINSYKALKPIKTRAASIYKNSKI